MSVRRVEGARGLAAGQASQGPALPQALVRPGRQVLLEARVDLGVAVDLAALRRRSCQGITLLS